MQWLKKDLLNRMPVAGPLHEVEEELDQWLETDYGNYLLEQERRGLEGIPALPGYHLLQLGMTPRRLVLDVFPHLHRFALSSGEAVPGGAAVADFGELPLPADSIDTLLIHHALDFSPSPHSVLREAVRVLMPGGHIVIVGFNPLSPWGALKPAGRLFSQRAIWRYNSLLRGRVIDWLAVLHCTPVFLKWGGHQPPGSKRWCHERFSSLDDWGSRLWPILGAFYIIVARKMVVRPLYQKGLRWSRLPVPSFAMKQDAARAGVNTRSKV